MRHYKITVIFLVFFCYACTSCGKGDEPGEPAGAGGEEIVIDPAVEYQEIDGFGASDAWRCQFVGKNWPESKKEAIADLLFSQELKEDGSPKGIGLSLWRFYLGAGSAEQGTASGITSDWRRAECFLAPDGTYDWTKHQGQQWFLNAAKERGVEKFLAFTIAPPVQFSKNGMATAPADGSMNIQAGKMDDYADFLVRVCEHFKQQGTPFHYLSPVNEPQWGWTGNGQEGTPATNSEVAELVRFTASGLDQKGLETQVVAAEAGSLVYLHAGDKAGRDHQIDDFFKPGSANSIAGLPRVANLISGHSYFTTFPNQTLISTREQLGAKLAATPGTPGFWQSEFCVLENTDEIGGGWNRDLTMNTALYVARVIHYDLTLANARSWQWWTALSQYNYKDGLIFLDRGNSGISGPAHPDAEPLKYDGFVRESKLLWALGNYSRFIRPGMVRVKCGFTAPKPEHERAKDLMVSAWKDTQSQDLVVVLVNYAAGEKKITLRQEGLKATGGKIDAYITSPTASLQKTSMDRDQIVIAGRSVVTLCLKQK
ncbi:MAG: glycoside hydrolase [Prolixibacteraceae bacterium]